MATYFNIFHFSYIVWGSIIFLFYYMCQVFKGVAPFVNCIFRLNSVFYLPFCTFTKWYVSDMFKVFSVIVCFTSFKYMVLKSLVRTSSFHLTNLFYNVSFIFCCIFLRDLGKHLLLRLDETVYIFCYLRSAIAFLLYSVCSKNFIICP